MGLRSSSEGASTLLAPQTKSQSDGYETSSNVKKKAPNRQNQKHIWEVMTITVNEMLDVSAK